MTEVLDRIEEELVAAARRRATAPVPAHRRARASRRTLALAGAGALLAGGGAVAGVTTGRDAPDEVPTRIERSLLASGAASDGARVSITVGEAPHRSTIVAYEADRAYGVRGSQALCIGAFSADTPSGARGYAMYSVPCQGPWPRSEGSGLGVLPVPGSYGARYERIATGLVPPEVRRAEILLPDGTRSAAKLSAPFTVDLSGQPGEQPVPGTPLDDPPPGGSVSARLVAAATAERPQAAVLTYADGRTERVALAGG
jgi:hypothetical protein